MDIFPTPQSLVFMKDKRTTGTCGMMDMGMARDALQSTGTWLSCLSHQHRDETTDISIEDTNRIKNLHHFFPEDAYQNHLMSV